MDSAACTTGSLQDLTLCQQDKRRPQVELHVRNTHGFPLLGTKRPRSVANIASLTRGDLKSSLRSRFATSSALVRPCERHAIVRRDAVERRVPTRASGARRCEMVLRDVSHSVEVGCCCCCACVLWGGACLRQMCARVCCGRGGCVKVYVGRHKAREMTSPDQEVS